MKITNLEQMCNAPQKGYILAYTPKGLIFKSYNSKEDLMSITDDLLEIHLFDSEREYRAIVTSEKRFNGIIEHCANFEYDENVVIKENVSLENEIKVMGELVVMSLFNKEEDGTVSLSDYRLAVEEKK